MSLNSSWRIPPIGLFIVCIVLTLTFLGLVVLFSASQAMYEGNPYVLLRKQIIWLLLASLAGGSVMVLDLEAIRKYAYLFLVVSTALLLLVLTPGLGVEVNGARPVSYTHLTLPTTYHG